MKITKRLLAILVAVATMTTTAAAANVLEGTGSATGEVPVTIQVTGLTIRATLPVSINLPVDINTVAHDAMVSTTLTVANNTTTSDLPVPIKVSFGKLADTPAEITIKTDSAAVGTDVTSPSSEVAIALANGETRRYLSPSAAEDEYTDTLTDTITYTLELYSSPAFKFVAQTVPVGIMFKVSLY